MMEIHAQTADSYSHLTFLLFRISNSLQGQRSKRSSAPFAYASLHQSVSSMLLGQTISPSTQEQFLRVILGNTRLSAINSKRV